MQKNNLWTIENKKLDFNQIKSINNTARNNLVIASAGSGKTTTIIGKVKHLIWEKGIDYNQILCLSFTNKSAAELKTRIKQELNLESDVLTFHKLGINIINTNITMKKKYLTRNEFVIVKIMEDLLNDEKFLEDFLKYFYKTNNFKQALLLFESEYYTIMEYAKEAANYINLIKQEGLTIDELLKKSRNNKYQQFLKIFIPIFNNYQEYLLENNLIDFNDMITIASNLIKTNIVKLPYKYIIIDEYQDISNSRFNLVKEIYDKNNADLFCVGDDYQCIFSYAGSKLDFFINFEKYFGKFNLNIINKTYRFNQMLSDISSKFITKNKKQFKKEVKSFKNNNTVSLRIIDENDLGDELLELPAYSKIFFLGRYKHDLEKLENNHSFNIEKKKTIYFRKRIDLEISFLTVHQAKGLEADYVFIINNEKGKMGFPSEKKNSYIERIIFNRSHSIEEERRLYYVAITRARVATVLLKNKDKPSIFLWEVERLVRKQPVTRKKGGDLK